MLALHHYAGRQCAGLADHEELADVEIIDGDHRRLWRASGEGFAWASNFVKES